MFQRLVAEKTPAGWRSRIELAPLVASSRLASATIRTSLFAATDESNIPDGVASQLAEVFSNDIDFRRSLKKGDRLAVVYETLEADGEPLRSGKVLSAEFVNAGHLNDHGAQRFSAALGAALAGSPAAEIQRVTGP